MASMRLAAITLAFVIARPAQAESIRDWRPLVAEASRRCGMPTRWIERVMAAESAGQTMLHGRPIRSRAGAMGLMQLMPATWEAMRKTLGLGNDPDNPRDNIIAGTCYLRMMYDRFGYPGLFGAYNAGPGRYAAHLASGRPLPGETVSYLGTVSGSVSPVAKVDAEIPRDTLFAIQRAQVFGRGTGVATQPPPLFVVRRDGE